MDKYIIYEQEKRRLQSMQLKPEEYEREIRLIAKMLGI